MGGVDERRWGEAVFVEMQISGSRLGIDGKRGGGGWLGDRAKEA